MKWGRLFALVLSFSLVAACDSGDDNTAPGTDVIENVDVQVEQDSEGNVEDVNTNPPDVGCVPVCGARICGESPNCPGMSCGTCGEGSACTPAGTCVCEKQCDGHECGPDGCGGECGRCDLGFICDDSSYLCVSGGDISCASYFVCLDACGDDADCVTDCGAARADGVVDLTDTLSDCLDTNCADCEDMTCLQECGRTDCGQDYVDCFSGDGVCFVVVGCVRDCMVDHPYGDPTWDACRLDCVALGTADEQGTYLALETCVAEVCDRSAPPSEYQECERSAMGRECIAESARCPEL